MESCVGCGGHFLKTRGTPSGFKVPDYGSFICPHCQKIWEKEGKTRKIPGLYTGTARHLEDYCWFAVWEDRVRRGELSPQMAQEFSRNHIETLTQRYQEQDREAAARAKMKACPEMKVCAH